MSDQPLVSILTASYNQGGLIEETLDSALGQTYRNLEVIVADDCSTDSTREIVRGYADRHPGRVKLIEAEANGGPCRRRNDALATAEGELIAWLDGDDLWLPEKIAKQVEVMRSDPEVGLVHTGFEKFDSETGKTVLGGVTEVPEGDLLAPLFAQENFIGSLTAMFRRKALEDRGQDRLRDVEFAYGDDYYAWLVIALDWRIAGIDEVLARYRMHGENLSFRQGNHLLKRIALLEDFTEEFPEAAERLGRWRRIGIGRHYLDAGTWELRHGSRLAALRYWARGLVRTPLSPLIRTWRRLLSAVYRLAQRIGLR